MQDRRIEFGDISYRLYRNRRIVVVSAGLSAIGPLLSALIGGQGSFFADPAALSAFVAGWTALMGFLVVRFPNGWMDPIALSLALIPFAALTPVYEALLGVAEDNAKVIGALWLIFLVTFGWLFTYLGILYLMCALLPRYGLGEIRSRSRVKSHLTAEQAFAAFVPQPDMSNSLRTTGPVDEDGFFPVTMHARMPDPEDFEVTDWSGDYRVKILEREGLRQVSLIVVDQPDGTVSSSVEIQTCIADGAHCIYEHEEVHDHFDILGGLGYWLQDFGSDAYQAEIEMLEGGPKRAIRFASHDNLLMVMARFFKAREADQPPSG